MLAQIVEAGGWGKKKEEQPRLRILFSKQNVVGV